jgi:hypothetical protein
MFNEQFTAPLELQLQRLIKEAEAISGEWNGDEPGLMEDRAHIANDVIETTQKLIELLNEEV